MQITELVELIAEIQSEHSLVVSLEMLDDGSGRFIHSPSGEDETIIDFSSVEDLESLIVERT